MFKFIYFLILNLNFLIYLLDCKEVNDESASKPYTNKTIFKNSGHSRGPPPQQQQPLNIPPPPPYNYPHQNVRMPFQQRAVQLQPAIAQPPEIVPPPPYYGYVHRIVRPIQQHHQQQQQRQQQQPPNIPPPQPYNYRHRMPFQQPGVQVRHGIAQPPEIVPPPPYYGYHHRIIRPIQQQHHQQQQQPIIELPLPLQVHNLNQQERNQLQQAIANAEQYQPLFQQLFGNIQQNQQQYPYPHAYYPRPQQQQQNWQQQFAQPGAHQYWQHPPPAAQQMPVHYPQQNVQLPPQLAAQQPQPPPQAANQFEELTSSDSDSDSDSSRRSSPRASAQIQGPLTGIDPRRRTPPRSRSRSPTGGGRRNARIQHWQQQHQQSATQQVQLQPQLVAQQPQAPPPATFNPIQNVINQRMSNYDQTRLVAHFQTHNPVNPPFVAQFAPAVRILDESGVRPHVIAREYDVPEQTVRQHLERPHSPIVTNRVVANHENSNEMRKRAWNEKLRRHYPDLPEVAALSEGLGNPPAYPVRGDLESMQWHYTQKRHYTAKTEWRQRAMFGNPKRRRNRLDQEGQRQVVEFYEQQNPGFLAAAPRNRYGDRMPPRKIKGWTENPQTMDDEFARGIYDLYHYGSVPANYLQQRYFTSATSSQLVRRMLDSRGVHLFGIEGMGKTPMVFDQTRIEQAKQALMDHARRVEHDMSPGLPSPIRTPDLQRQLMPQPQAEAGTGFQHPLAANQLPVIDLTDSDSDQDRERILVPQPNPDQPSTSGGMAVLDRGGRRRSPPRRLPSRTPSPVRPRLGIFSRNRPRGPAQIQGPPTGGLKRRTPPRSRSRSPAGGGRRMG